MILPDLTQLKMAIVGRMGDAREFDRNQKPEWDRWHAALYRFDRVHADGLDYLVLTPSYPDGMVWVADAPHAFIGDIAHAVFNLLSDPEPSSGQRHFARPGIPAPAVLRRTPLYGRHVTS